MTEPVVRHSLKNRDEKTLTAECSVCGFVAIRKSGTGYRCAVKLAEKHRSWAKANPRKATANRQQRSDHTLFNRDYRNLTADCVACDKQVDLVMYGSGYTCGVRARELRVNQQTAFAGQWCRECQIIDGAKVRVTANGCPRCSDQRLSDTASVLRDQEHSYRHGGREQIPDGMHLAYDSDDPNAMPDDESVVPGWGRNRVLGSNRPWNEV